MNSKLIFSLIATLLFSYHVQAQKGWDSTYRPANFYQKVSNFKSYKNSKKDIIFFGNSITDYAAWNELLESKYARNRGISGDITFGLLERIDEIVEGKPSKVFILIGINDISRNIPDTIILRNFDKIIKQIQTRTPKTKIYFNSILPVNNTFTARNHFNKDEHIAAINQELRRLCLINNVTFLNSHDIFLDTNQRLDSRYTYDGLHLNAAGYLLWAKFLNRYL